jgi:membrane-associated phospholipid phosphatase
MQQARILSFVFHPVWMPLVTYLTVYHFDQTMLISPYGHDLIMLLLLLSILAPAVSILIMVRNGMLGNLELTERKERTIPFTIVIFYYTLMLVVLWWRAPGLPRPVFAMLIGVLALLVLGLVINRFWKISVHMMAQGGWFGTLVALGLRAESDLVFQLMVATLIAGLVGYARVKLGVHSTQQVLAGFALGAIVNAAAQLTVPGVY